MNAKDQTLRALPPNLRQGATDLKNSLWGGYKQHHYSQFGEDVVLGPLLRGISGFYVDVGANHPKRYSNTYLLYKRGWEGLNIDPNKDAIAAFKQVRPRDISVALAIGSDEGIATLYRYADPAFNTLSKEVAEKLKEKKWLSPLPTALVPVVPLSAALAAHLPPGVTIDFMNVDVEGLDLSVLESNDWSRFSPRVIAVEDHSFTPETPQKSAIFSFLKEKGYTLKAHVGPTLIAVRSV